MIKVESTRVPMAPGWAHAGHFARLDHGKEPVTVDLTTPLGRAELQRLVDGADVVITSARPRALDQLGLDPAESLRARSAPGLADRSPATAPVRARPTGWHSATTPPPPVAWSSGTTGARASVPTPWPTR